MGRTMLQFHHPGDPPSLAQAVAAFGLADGDLDADFGVVATDPDAGLFVVRVEERVLERVRSVLATRPPHPAEGLFGDPRVEPFGPAPGA